MKTMRQLIEEAALVARSASEPQTIKQLTEEGIALISRPSGIDNANYADGGEFLGDAYIIPATSCTMPPEDYPKTRDYADLIQSSKSTLAYLHDAFLLGNLPLAQHYSGELFQLGYELTRLSSQLLIERNNREKGYDKWQPTQKEIIDCAKENARKRKEEYETKQREQWEAQRTKERVEAEAIARERTPLGTKSDRNKPFEYPPKASAGSTKPIG